MQRSEIRSLVLLILSITCFPVLATDYGCALDDPAATLATDAQQRWLAALNSGDASTLSAVYAPNAVLMPPTDETIVGAEPIASYLQSQGFAQVENYSIDLVACELTGDTLEIAGVWGAEQTDGRGLATALTGNVIRILDRSGDGDWRTRMEIWN